MCSDGQRDEADPDRQGNPGSCGTGAVVILWTRRPPSSNDDARRGRSIWGRLTIAGRGNLLMRTWGRFLGVGSSARESRPALIIGERPSASARKSIASGPLGQAN